jgi:hypothetical protein
MMVSSSYFQKIWFKYRSNYKIRKILEFAKCSTCSHIRKEFANTKDQTTKKSLSKQFEQHIYHVQSERILYRKKRCYAHQYPSECLSIIIDGTAQGSWGLPYFGQKDKENDTLPKLKTHITGVLVHGHGAFIYTCPQKFKGGTNLTVEVLTRVLKNIEQKYLKEKKLLPNKLFIQLDNTCKENRNKILFSFFDLLLRRGIFNEIYISFLPVGHTHEGTHN